MKLLLTHIADLDVITPIILMNLLKENFEYKLFDYHESNYYLNNYDFACVLEEIVDFKGCEITMLFKYLKEKVVEYIFGDSYENR